ncbi:spermidine synthase [Pseudomonadota bacterium]
MRPWELLDTVSVPGEGKDLSLHQRGEEFSIKAGYSELMNSRVHGSEDALAELGCERIAKQTQARVLIGGLGMGYTLAAALQKLGPAAEVVVAELVPAVVTWNRGPLAPLAGSPLNDQRVAVHEGDVAQLIRSSKGAYDAILLDVDNGPEGLTRKENDSLYSPAGLSAAMAALRPGGVLGVWSISPEPAFTKRLRRAGFSVEEVRVRARGRHGGGRHMIWFASKQ